MSGCEPPELEPSSTGITAVSDARRQTTGVNPFSVALMRQAYKSLKNPKKESAALATTRPQRGSGRTAASSSSAVEPESPSDCLECPPPSDPTPTDPTPVQPTHLYLRFKADNTNQLADLEDAGLRLSWEPLDESVAANTTVDFQSENIAWIYTVVPTGTPLPAGIPREQIQELFLFNAEDGDAQDVDPWEPAPDPGPAECQTQYDPSCNCYLQCPVARTASANKKGKLTNQAKATQKLKDAGVSPLALYNEAMRLSGNPDEVMEGKLAGAQARHRRYNPRGTVRVEDTDLGMVPLRGVKVESRRWFQFGSTFTDNQGGFYIGTSYSNMAKLSLEFKNSLATTRGIISGVRVWQAVLPINAELGSYSGTSMETVLYDISFQGGLDKRESKGASTWTAATLFNTLADEQTFAAARGLPAPPQNLNVWLFPYFPKSNGGGSGAAPMLRKMAGTPNSGQIIDYLLIGSGAAGSSIALLRAVLQRQFPDITIRYSGDQGALASHQLQPLLYHELGHAQHYGQVGNDFWTGYIAHIVQHDGYGEKTDSGSGRIAISEGWGEYVQRLFTINKYQGTNAGIRASDALDYLDQQVPSDVNGVAYNQGWFVYGMYHDMTDNTPEPTGVIDNVTAYTPVSIFRGLQSDVVSVRGYQSKVNAQTNGLQSFEVGQLVTSYRW
ncbi:hypothetical protein BEN47_03055 [Hymenobacter lapidarius]|uniref:Uncharacterized protein n=1 Tax=Hymenobacter lapidarius TaxID=1908237 RepID=A0A1G1T0F0_9BACT|nr:hypothetical protein [Hymenobacter lapidarius]OGX84355.1 hypothetical protein BEN47_03055 [Hymenobacter lapidarius]